MKKYLLSLIIILIFSSLAFGQSIVISKIAMHGPGDDTVDEVSYGQTIYVKATCTSSGVSSVDNVYVNAQRPGEIAVLYYDGLDPSTSNYLGYAFVAVNSLDGLTTGTDIPISFNFTLPTFSSSTAYSFQILFGMYSYDGFGFPADRYTSYISGLGYSNTSGAYTDWFEYLKGVNDGPLPVTLSSFNVSFVNGKPTLYWTTESESNNAGWIVYRSYGANPLENGFTQLNLSEIPGQGTTTEPTDYVFVDEYPIFENQTYWYLLESICTDGVVETYPLVQITIPLGGTDPGTPNADPNYGLKQNFPNPFNPDTEINFMINEDSLVELIIYNQKGEKIKTIFKDNVQGEVLQSAYWNGEDENGKTVATGVYLYRLRTNSTSYTKRMLLMK
jgi:hypothetical protein